MVNGGSDSVELVVKMVWDLLMWRWRLVLERG